MREACVEQCRRARGAHQLVVLQHRVDTAGQGLQVSGQRQRQQDVEPGRVLHHAMRRHVHRHQLDQQAVEVGVQLVQRVVVVGRRSLAQVGVEGGDLQNLGVDLVQQIAECDVACSLREAMARQERRGRQEAQIRRHRRGPLHPIAARHWHAGRCGLHGGVESNDGSKLAAVDGGGDRGQLVGHGTLGGAECDHALAVAQRAADWRSGLDDGELDGRGDRRSVHGCLQRVGAAGVCTGGHAEHGRYVAGGGCRAGVACRIDYHVGNCRRGEDGLVEGVSNDRGDRGRAARCDDQRSKPQLDRCWSRPTRRTDRHRQVYRAARGGAGAGRGVLADDAACGHRVAVGEGHRPQHQVSAGDRAARRRLGQVRRHSAPAQKQARWRRRDSRPIQVRRWRRQPGSG